MLTLCVWGDLSLLFMAILELWTLHSILFLLLKIVIDFLACFFYLLTQHVLHTDEVWYLLWGLFLVKSYQIWSWLSILILLYEWGGLLLDGLILLLWWQVLLLSWLAVICIIEYLGDLKNGVPSLLGLLTIDSLLVASWEELTGLWMSTNWWWRPQHLLLLLNTLRD